MTEVTKSSRRTFFRRTTAGAAGAMWISSLQEFGARKLQAAGAVLH